MSLVIHHQSILENPHFWTEFIVVILLPANGVISLIGFGGNKLVIRTVPVHAYLGSTALCLLFLHAVLGLKLGLAI